VRRISHLDTTSVRAVVVGTSNLWDRPNCDTRRPAIVNYIYDLPLFKGKSDMTGKLLVGWEIAGTAQFQTGTPCGIGTNNDFAGVVNSAASAQGQFWILKRHAAGLPAVSPDRSPLRLRPSISPTMCRSWPPALSICNPAPRPTTSTITPT
jgi:hypothetical protein